VHTLLEGAATETIATPLYPSLAWLGLLFPKEDGSGHSSIEK